MQENNIESKEKNKFIGFVMDKKKIAIFIASVLVIIVGGGTGFLFSVKNNVDSWNNKIYSGISTYGVDLSGQTYEEAKSTLESQLITQINNKLIKVRVGEQEFQLSYNDINSSIDVESIVQEALSYKKDANLFEKVLIIKNGVNHELKTSLTYDEGKISEFSNSINDSVKVEPTNATININSGAISITNETIGKKINVETLADKIKESISPDNLEGEAIVAELEESAPRVTAGELQKINGVVASFSGSYVNSAVGRVTNMKIATNSVNGTLLMPGDEFSYNKTIGETTPENGYKEAGAYVAGEVVQEYGGGVCHISTSLYRAAMRANLKSSLRYNHSMMVSYSEPSLDATVYEGDIDYRFINTYDFPVYIEGYMTSDSIVFNIYGNKEAFGSNTYELVNEVTEKLDYTTEYINDATIAEGSRVTTVSGMPGYRSKAYLVTYSNGAEVGRELISTDYYAPMNTIVKVGVKKATT
ncbi:MAG: VanW family protein [Clostridium sp.]|nr:VanW family protein [Clostridium sp.]